VGNKINVLVTGNTGTGKTVACEHMLSVLPETHAKLTMKLSAGTLSSTTQGIIESVLEKRSKDKFGPLGGKQLVIFIDDFNLPHQKDQKSSKKWQQLWIPSWYKALLIYIKTSLQIRTSRTGNWQKN
jgi:dynein heavy chain